MIKPLVILFIITLYARDVFTLSFVMFTYEDEGFVLTL